MSHQPTSIPPAAFSWSPTPTTSRSGEPLTADVIDQKSVRITLTGPLSGPVTLNYRVTNGLAEAEGSITVVEIPQPTIYQPPIAADDSVTVRVGDAIDIPVLNNDVQPDGADLTLDADARERHRGGFRTALRVRPCAAVPRPRPPGQLLGGLPHHRTGPAGRLRRE